jgi:hypothetical protein
MILIEKEIEKAVRAAIRTSLNSYSATTPELEDTVVIGYWLPSEENGPTEDASGLRVMLMAHPSSSEGYAPGTGFDRIRKVELDVMCISQPDTDDDRHIMVALYEAVRSAFEAASPAFTFVTGLQLGGMLISNGGAAELDDVGQITSFTVSMHMLLTS